MTPTKQPNVQQAALLIGVFALVAKLAALVRDSLLAGVVGPGAQLDAYFAAFRLPDLVFGVLILGTLPIAFIPVYTALLRDEGTEAANRTASSIINIAALGTTALCAVLWLLSHPLNHLLTPGFVGVQAQTTALLSRTLLITPVIFTLSSLCSAILNSHRKFFYAALSPVLYNGGIIVGALVFYPRIGTQGLAWGAVLGSVLHLVVQLPDLRRTGFRWYAELKLRTPALQKVAKLYLPRLLSFDVSQFGLLVATWVASQLPVGSLSIFTFASNIAAVPLGLVAYPFAQAAFPELSDAHAAGDKQRFFGTLTSSLSKIVFYTVPAAVLVLVLRAHVVRLALGYGSFDWDATVATFTTLGVFMFGLLTQAIIPLLSRTAAARHDTKTPMLINLISLVVMAVTAPLLGARYGAPGLAAALVLASWLSAALLLITAPGPASSPEEPHVSFIPPEAGRTALAALCGGLVCYGALYVVAGSVDTHTVLGLGVQAGVAGLLGSITFLFVAAGAGVTEATELLALGSRLWYSVVRRFR